MLLNVFSIFSGRLECSLSHKLQQFYFIAKLYLYMPGFFSDTKPDKIPHEIIQERFGINMPQDFYDLWEFCKELNPQRPQGM